MYAAEVHGIIVQNNMKNADLCRSVTIELIW